MREGGIGYQLSSGWSVARQVSILTFKPFEYRQTEMFVISQGLSKDRGARLMSNEGARSQYTMANHI